MIPAPKTEAQKSAEATAEQKRLESERIIRIEQERKASADKISRQNMERLRQENKSAEETIRKTAGKYADVVLTLLKHQTDNFNPDKWLEDFSAVIEEMLGDDSEAERILYATVISALATKRNAEKSGLIEVLFTLVAKKHPKLLPAVRNVIEQYCNDDSSEDNSLINFVRALEFAIDVQVTTVANANADVKSQQIFLQRMCDCLPTPRTGLLEESTRYAIYSELFLALFGRRGTNQKQLEFLGMLREVDYPCYIKIKQELRDTPENSFGIPRLYSQKLLLLIEGEAADLKIIEKKQEQTAHNDALLAEFLPLRNIDIFANAHLLETKSLRYDNSKVIAGFTRLHPELLTDHRMQYHLEVVVNKDLAMLARLLDAHYADCLKLFDSDLISKEDQVSTTITRLLTIFIRQCDRHELRCSKSEDLKKYLAAKTKQRENSCHGEKRPECEAKEQATLSPAVLPHSAAASSSAVSTHKIKEGLAAASH